MHCCGCTAALGRMPGGQQILLFPFGIMNGCISVGSPSAIIVVRWTNAKRNYATTPDWIGLAATCKPFGKRETKSGGGDDLV